LLSFTQGIDLDRPLAACEIKVQKAWARGLRQVGLLQGDELGQLEQALDQALELILNDRFEWRIEDEDIHMNLERFLGEKTGPLAKKIHVGRSRNDLIATTLRLFVRDRCEDMSAKVQGLIDALLFRAEKDLELIVPGLTHLQFGQPIRYSHIYLSHAWGLKRDQERLHAAAEAALKSMPLGSAALGGTHIDIDLEGIAEELGFSSPPLNSYDSVGDRDFMLQSLQAFALTAIHLSRLAEDCIIWSSQPYQWIRLPKSWSTGSSIMPNKRNPDIPELIRAKSAQVIGAEQSAQLLLKGLVSSYSSDLHELKRIYLQALPALGDSLKVFPEFIKGLEPQSEKIKGHLQSGHLLATEVANQLTEEGKAFREAYGEVAALVSKAEAQGKQIHELGFDIGFEQTVEKRKNRGGTARASILKQIEQLRST
jgi:argininosuccinate lyase